MSDDSTRPIIIKRKKVVAGGHHGGAWKIAYADFVTAMMAFFLLMWLLGSTAKGDLQGIADFFQNPLKVGMSGGSGTGDASSVIQGGGKDLTRTAGQVKSGEVEAKRKTINLKETNQELLRKQFEQQEKAKLNELKQRIEKVFEGSSSL
ncbi:MAG: chemotaxis protein MotB, partial [Pseudomonadota bacterium]|nr:chemotaxis protein MotB [Pseudomonadota bacterium]